MFAQLIHSRQLAASSSSLINRALSTSACLCGKKSRTPYDRRFPMTPKDVNEWKEGGSKKVRKELGKNSPFQQMRPQPPGYYDKDDKFIFVPEMVPEFIVPDLTDFKLKPYVSYKVTDINQTEFEAKDLFDALYSKKVIDDWQEGKLDENDPENTYLKTPSNS